MGILLQRVLAAASSAGLWASGWVSVAGPTRRAGQRLREEGAEEMEGTSREVAARTGQKGAVGKWTREAGERAGTGMGRSRAEAVMSVRVVGVRVEGVAMEAGGARIAGSKGAVVTAQVGEAAARGAAGAGTESSMVGEGIDLAVGEGAVAMAAAAAV